MDQTSASEPVEIIAEELRAGRTFTSRNAVLTNCHSDLTETAFRLHSLGQWGTHTDPSLDHAV